MSDEPIPALPIKRNAIKCNHCGDVVESTSRHDFKYCKCGTVFVDGGKDYQRIGFYGPDDYENLIEYEDDNER